MQHVKKISSLILVGILLLAFCQPVVAADGKININTGSKQELVTLKYVGEKLADRIIEYRKKHPFEKSEDIKNVKGIGDKIFEANKKIIVVRDEP